MFDFEALTGVEQEALAERQRQRACAAKARLESSLAAPTKGRELRICTYNLLAPCYFRAPGAPGGFEAGTEFWRPRLEGQLLAVGGAVDPDVLCLQEVWFDKEALEMLRSFAVQHGYEVLLCRRRGWVPKDDGLAMLVRTSRIEVVDSEEQELCREGSRVLLKALLRVRQKGDAGPDFVLACTHLTYPHDDSSNRLRMVQAHIAGRACVEYANMHRRSGRSAMALALVGDFNVRSGDVENDAALGALLCDHWRSAFAEVHGREAAATHRTHRGNLTCADFVLLRGGLRAASAAALPLAEESDAPMPQVQLGGAAPSLASLDKQKRRGFPETVAAWSQLSDHRPVLATVVLDEVASGEPDAKLGG